MLIIKKKKKKGNIIKKKLRKCELHLIVGIQSKIMKL